MTRSKIRHDQADDIHKIVFLSGRTALVNIAQMNYIHNCYPRRINRMRNKLRGYKLIGYKQLYSVKGSQGNSNKSDLSKWRLAYKKKENISRREEWENWYKLTQLDLELRSAFLEEGLLTAEELDAYHQVRTAALIYARNFKGPMPNWEIYTRPRTTIPNSSCNRY